MKRIQILATRPYGHCFPVISWLIRLLSWSPHSHVVIYFPEERKIRHAHFNEFKEEEPDAFFEKNRLVDMKTVYLSEDQYAKLDSYSASKIGKQEGYFCTLFGSLIPQVLKSAFGLKLGNPFCKGMTCSEYVRESLRQANEVLVFVLTSTIPKGTFNTKEAMELANNFLQ